ncbi:JAB domain-containing protein, partial [Streptococcus suis]
YFSKANKFSIENTRIKSPDDIQDFIMTRYDNYDNINVALYLDTKNTIIESEILPENLTSKEEAKHIIEKAILHDSKSFALSTKTNASHIRYSEESIDRVSNIKQLADLVGINLIDNVAVNNLSSLSYKGSHLLEPKEKYKAKTREKVKKEKPKFNVEELKNKTKSSTQNKQVEKRKKSRSL